MDSFMKFIVDMKLLDVAIGGMGIFGLALICERVKSLFGTYSMAAQPFMEKIFKLVEDEKVEEAIAYCAANEKKPLAYVVKRILERSDREDEALETSFDIAAAEIAPGLTRNLAYLSMVSNVVTLIGLLGTVVGLIMSFKAVAFADPSQKQTLLADGISLAMHSTAMGLLVAIPVMVAYSFLHAKQGRLFSEVDQWAAKTVELLKNRGFDKFVHASVVTGNQTEKKVKIPAPSKVA
jgi:biopolymer transport protein ExbB/TolQ